MSIATMTDASPLTKFARGFSQGSRRLTIAVACVLLVQTADAGQKSALPSEIMSAKSIFLVNQTGDQAVLDAAYDQFRKWNRFEIAPSQGAADLTIVFLRKNGMDKWGNLGFIEMNVFPKESKKVLFSDKKAAHLIFEPQIRTVNCIREFRNRVEQKP